MYKYFWYGLKTLRLCTCVHANMFAHEKMAFENFDETAKSKLFMIRKAYIYVVNDILLV